MGSLTVYEYDFVTLSEVPAMYAGTKSKGLFLTTGDIPRLSGQKTPVSLRMTMMELGVHARSLRFPRA